PVPFPKPGGSWTLAGTKVNNDSSQKETWVKLADGSILSYDMYYSLDTGVGHAERYIPSKNEWVSTGSVPVLLSSSSNKRMGPALLLPDGRAFFLGSNGHTAFYTPSSDQWTAGPDIPDGFVADQAPAALM